MIHSWKYGVVCLWRFSPNWLCSGIHNCTIFPVHQYRLTACYILPLRVWTVSVARLHICISRLFPMATKLTAGKGLACMVKVKGWIEPMCNPLWCSQAASKALTTCGWISTYASWGFPSQTGTVHSFKHRITSVVTNFANALWNNQHGSDNIEEQTRRDTGRSNVAGGV
jgi:hypothetical protein